MRRLPLVVPLHPTQADVHVRAAHEEDLDFCAALQAATLPHGFFAQLGHSFLRVYLRTFLLSPHAAARLLTVRGVPVGMVVGVLRPRSHGRWVLRNHGFCLAVAGAAALIVRPRVATHFVQTRARRYARVVSRRQNAVATEKRKPPAVLSHVAVVPGADGAGFGRRLVEEFVDVSRDGGASAVALATLADDRGAAGFYRRLGWEQTSTTYDFDGNALIIFTVDVEPVPR